MKNLIFIFLILLSFTGRAKAETNYLDYFFLDQPKKIWLPDSSGQRPDVESICKELKYNYLEEIDRLHINQRKLSDKLEAADALTPEALTLIEFYKAEINEATTRLKFLARPEWNTEVLEYGLRWYLPLEYTQKLRLIKGYKALSVRYLNKNDGTPFADLELHSDLPIISQTSFTDLTRFTDPPPFIDRPSYADIIPHTDLDLFTDLAPFTDLDSYRHLAPYTLKRSYRVKPIFTKPMSLLKNQYFFEYRKLSTYLEICQLMPTLRFEIELETEFPIGDELIFDRKQPLLLETAKK